MKTLIAFSILIFALQAQAKTCLVEIYAYDDFKDSETQISAANSLPWPDNEYLKKEVETNDWKECFTLARTWAAEVGLFGDTTTTRFPGPVTVYAPSGQSVQSLFFRWYYQDATWRMNQTQGSLDFFSTQNPAEGNQRKFTGYLMNHRPN